jgi:uncharacterized protein DUF3551
MRILALAILAIGSISMGPAAAQTYDRGYPVCMRVHAHSYECLTSLPQCNASASGRAAQCFINPQARKCPRIIGGIASASIKALVPEAICDAKDAV